MTRPVSEETRAVLESNRAGAPQLTAPAAGEGADEIPAPGTTGALGRLRLALNRVLTEGIPLEDGHGNGHAERAAVTAGEQGQPALDQGTDDHSA